MNRILSRILVMLTVWVTPALGQTWVKIANEGDTVITTSQVTVRYGSPTCGTAGCWATLTTTGTIYVNNTTFGDPAPGTVKELDILQTAAGQMVTVNGSQVVISGSSTTSVTGTASTSSGSITTQPVTAALSASSTSCKIPKNGGSCTIYFPTVTVPSQTVPLPSSAGTYTFSCTGTDMQHLACTAIRQ